jgi:hypothetical protein
MVSLFYSQRVLLEVDSVIFPVGTTISTAIALIVMSGSNRVSGKDAFTLLENNSGWGSGTYRSLDVSSLADIFVS